jgi:hypothetical protein
MWNISGRLGNQMFQFAYIYAQMRKGLIPDVYVQDEKYFKEFAGEIKRLYGDNIGFTDYVSIHVRRKDYVNNSFYVDLFANGYYERAMALFPNNTFIVFSDDIEWCKEQEIFKGCAFSDGNDEIEDLNMMASCKSNIIANSSFSWWAAYLNINPLKKVVAPKDWYTLSAPNDGEQPISSTGLPDKWIKI